MSIACRVTVAPLCAIVANITTVHYHMSPDPINIQQLHHLPPILTGCYSSLSVNATCMYSLSVNIYTLQPLVHAYVIHN